VRGVEETPIDKAIGAAVLAGAGLTVLAPTAHADDATDEFRYDMRSAGLRNHNGDTVEISLGVRVCTELSQGIRPLAVTREIYRGSQLSRYGGGQFVAISVKDLCPQYLPEAMPDALGALGVPPAPPWTPGVPAVPGQPPGPVPSRSSLSRSSERSQRPSPTAARY